jgi:5-(carboxyamino)imidazole ribonucleotide synthase
VPLYPRADVLHVCQNRQREKAWLRENGFPHVGYAEALDGDIAAAVARTGLPCVVKTADFGYDGKGQMKLANAEDVAKAAAIFRGRRCVVERWCEFSSEVSVIVARSTTGEVRAFPVAENVHTHHILDVSLVPARIPDELRASAEQLGVAIASKLGVVGLLAIEMFVTTGGEVLVNELAPRPHNSGHWSIDGCETSQFEQHVRAVCGLPLGGVAVREPTAMINILGDAWSRAAAQCREVNWPAILSTPRAKLHLYGKAEPRDGRKMGHFTVRAATVADAFAAALELKTKL